MKINDKFRVLIMVVLGLILLISLIVSMFSRSSDFYPSDFARFRLVEATVSPKEGSCVVIFTEQRQLLVLKKYFLQLKKMTSDYNRKNTDGYFMKVSFEDHKPLDVFFYNNQDFGRIIVINGIGYYNNDFWSFIDEYFQKEEIKRD